MLKKLLKRNQKKMTDSSKDDKEQTFIQHLEALRSMLINSIAAVVLLSPIGFWAAPKFINFLVKNSLPDGIVKLHYFSPMEVFLIQMKAGIVLAFPFIVYQVRKFVLPALYEHERKFLGILVFFATILFVLGAAFCVFCIMPLIMNFSASFSTAQLEPTLGLGNFVNLCAGLMLAFGLMFQMPLVVLTGVKFGLVSVKTLENMRPYIIVVILILAAVFTPPDVVSQLMLGVPTWLLFEAGIFVAKIIEKN